MKKFLEPERYEKAPGYPTDRPPTRKEVWTRQHFLYFDLKPHNNASGCTQHCLRPVKNAPDELTSRARMEFVHRYVDWYRKGWRKQPDWANGETVIGRAVPNTTFWNGEMGVWAREIYRCLELVTHHRRRAA